MYGSSHLSNPSWLIAVQVLFPVSSSYTTVYHVCKLAVIIAWSSPLGTDVHRQDRSEPALLP
eukprot:7524663-Pyramimonas_sp.AAC.2